jgi:diaminopimelate decarboxylase
MGMRKRYLLVGLACVGLLLVIGCGKTDYKDFVKVNTQFIDAMDEYTSNMDQANDAASIADATNQFADPMEKLAPEMKKIRGKYPQLRDKTKIPEELRSLNERAKQVALKFPQTLMKPMQYAHDPDVMAAVQRLQQAMGKMR